MTDTSRSSHVEPVTYGRHGRRALRRASARFALAGTVALGARGAHADPQWSAGALPSACILGEPGDAFRTAAFCGAVRGDVLFGRASARGLGVGPYASVGTAAFDDLRLAAGGSVLVPVVEDFPLVLSLGPLLRDGSALGVDASVFWGVRSYNFHGAWNFASGVVLGAQRTFGDAGDSVYSLGFQVDGFLFALPVLLVAGAAR